ncbi:MAG: translation initiation factor IF-2 N-terminal domain-containing protein, partial [Phascolarctobacterium sp.]|nr:translation initiation factor IF-2 N-terminal domain-containing protein [Phascolarctobacterium sp.]
MGTKRIYEVAKEYGKEAHEVLELLKKHNIEKTNFSGVDEQTMKVIKEAYDKKPAPAPQKVEAPKTAPQTQKPQNNQQGQKPQGQSVQNRNDRPQNNQQGQGFQNRNDRPQNNQQG